VDKHLKVTEKDYESAISSNQRLTEMNKDLQKSLMIVNEKAYALGMVVHRVCFVFKRAWCVCMCLFSCTDTRIWLCLLVQIGSFNN
jgi:hypothetical protein